MPPTDTRQHFFLLDACARGNPSSQFFQINNIVSCNRIRKQTTVPSPASLEPFPVNESPVFRPLSPKSLPTTSMTIECHLPATIRGRGGSQRKTCSLEAALTFQASTTLAAGGRGVSRYKYYQDGYACAPLSARTPPRSRGGRFTFALRVTCARPRGSPRVHAAGGSPSTYVGPSPATDRPACDNLRQDEQDKQDA